jgi:hypothetical protein
MEITLLLGFPDITELRRVVVPLQSGAVFGVPKPVICAEATVDKAMSATVLKNRDPNRCIVVLLIGVKGRRRTRTP